MNTCTLRSDTAAPNGLVERHVNEKAARLLISVTDYAKAERIYDGDTYMVADALGVTAEIAEAYQRWLDLTR